MSTVFKVYKTSKATSKPQADHKDSISKLFYKTPFLLEILTLCSVSGY